jgi:hypothetical protein
MRLWRGDDEYRTNASLPRLCHLLAELAYKWEKIESQSRRMSGSTSTQSADTRKKTSSSDRDRDRDKAQPNPISNTSCMGCNRSGHTREDCHHKKHPDFNRTGPWDGCRADRELKARGKTGDEIKLARGFRSDGTAIPRAPSGAPAAPSRYRRNDSDEGAGRRRDNDRRDRDGGRGGRGGREGRGNVHFARDTGTPCLTSSITHLTCNCGGADVNSTYRQCLVSIRNSTTYFTALTLFDTGAYTSFVNREVSKWLELQQHGRSAPCSI